MEGRKAKMLCLPIGRITCVESMPGSCVHLIARGTMPDSLHSIPKPAAGSLGMQRQFEIYQLGLAGKKLSVPIPVAQLENKAAEVLPPQAYDYVAGSASGQRSARANLAAFDRWRIVPRMLRDVSQRDLTVDLFGHTLPAP